MLGIFARPDLSLTDEELTEFRQRRRRLMIIIGVIIVVLAIGALSVRPAINMVRAWQARRHAYKAFALMDEQKWSEARGEAVAAYQLRATEPQAIRAVARLLSRAGQVDAIGFWKELKTRATLTPTDLRDEAGIAVKAREIEIAQGAIDELLKQPGPHGSDLVLAAQVAIQKQDFDGAINQIHKIFADNSATDRDRLQATILLASALRSKDAKDQTEVLEHLVQLGRGSNDVSLEALVALGQTFLNSQGAWPNPGGMSADELVRALETHPLAKPQHKLLAVDLKIRMQPEQKQEIIANMIGQLKNGDDAALIALAGWLNSHREHQLELDTISLQRSMPSRELFFQHVDALGALGRWDEIRRLIESEQFSLDPVVEHMYLARCFAQQGQTAGAENNWSRALEAAAGNADKLITLAEYAEKNDATDVAGAAYDAAVATQPKLRVAQQGRLRMAYAGRDTKKILAVLTELIKIWPNDPAVQNDEAYTRLLLLPGPPADNPQPITNNPELTEIEQIAENLLKREPASLPHRTLLALALLKQNRPYEAMTVYKGINVPRTALTTSTVSVHAAVLGATHEKEAARKEADTLPKDKLLPEEQALVEQAVK